MVESIVITDNDNEIPRGAVLPMRSFARAGVLVTRVTPDGEPVDGNVVLITGVDGVGAGADSVTVVRGRVVKIVGGKMMFADPMNLEYDPRLTAVQIGEINCRDPRNGYLFNIR